MHFSQITKLRPAHGSQRWLIAAPLLTVLLGAVLLVAVALGGTALAATMLAPFTQAELDPTGR